MKLVASFFARYPCDQRGVSSLHSELTAAFVASCWISHSSRFVQHEPQEIAIEVWAPAHLWARQIPEPGQSIATVE